MSKIKIWQTIKHTPLSTDDKILLSPQAKKAVAAATLTDWYTPCSQEALSA